MNTSRIASPRALALSAALMFTLIGSVGCAGRVSLLPNSDPALRQTPAQFAAEAAKRPYPMDIPDAGVAEARAQVAYDGNYIQLINLSHEDWNDVEVWVNRKYVVHVPRLEAGQKRVKSLTFMMLYDDQGNPFPSNNRKQMIDTLEVIKDGKRYSVPLKLAD